MPGIPAGNTDSSEIAEFIAHTPICDKMSRREPVHTTSHFVRSSRLSALPGNSFGGLRDQHLRQRDRQSVPRAFFGEAEEKLQPTVRMLLDTVSRSDPHQYDGLESKRVFAVERRPRTPQPLLLMAARGK